MPSDRRRDAATAVTGAGLLAGGGVMRHRAVERSAPVVDGKKAYGRVHGKTVWTKGTGRSKALWSAGSAVGLLGTAPLGVGAHRLVETRKADDRRPFLTEGLVGTAEALQGRSDSLRTRQPAQVRGAQLAAAGGAGALGSVAARAVLRKRPGWKPALSPIAGGLAAAASVPASNRVVNRLDRRYTVTSTGVRRAKDVARRPSSKASTARGRRDIVPSSFGKLDDQRKSNIKRGAAAGALVVGGRRTAYLGRALHRASSAKYPARQLLRENARYSASEIAGSSLLGGAAGGAVGVVLPVRKLDDYKAQRAAITAAGAAPLFGPVTQAAAAARYAPPGQQGKHAARQLGMGSVGSYAVGAAGGVGLAAAAQRRPGVAARAAQVDRKVVQPLQKPARAVGNAVRSKLNLPSGSNSKTVQRAGRAAAKITPGVVRRNPVAASVGFLGAKAVSNFAGTQGAISLNQRDQRRWKAGVSKFNAAGGQTKREKQKLASRKRTSAALSAVGGTAGLTSLGLLATGRKSAATTAGIIGGGFGGANALLNTPIQRKEAQILAPVKKKESLLTGQDRKTRESNIKTYGDRGPLPKQLSREQRMSAYESRYVHHGGDKSEKWKRRADVAEGTRNAGLAGAALGGAGWLASRSPRIARRLAQPKVARIKHKADTVAVGSGTVGAAAELYGEHAQSKQRSYANSPGGVAASALRRMRANTPGSTL